MKKLLLALAAVSIAVTPVSASQIPGKDVIRGSTDYVLVGGRVIQFTDNNDTRRAQGNDPVGMAIWDRLFDAEGNDNDFEDDE